MSHSVSPAAWKEFLAEHSDGGPFSATVASVMPYGAFVEVAPGIHGFLPQSSWATEPEVGSTLSVRIENIDLENRRMSLVPA